jgi:hypothetical protein
MDDQVVFGPQPHGGWGVRRIACVHAVLQAADAATHKTTTIRAALN